MPARPPPFMMPALYRTLKAQQRKVQDNRGELMHLRGGMMDTLTGSLIPALLLAAMAGQYAVGHYNMSHNENKKPGF